MCIHFMGFSIFFYKNIPTLQTVKILSFYMQKLFRFYSFFCFVLKNIVKHLTQATHITLSCNYVKKNKKRWDTFTFYVFLVYGECSLSVR